MAQWHATPWLATTQRTWSASWVSRMTMASSTDIPNYSYHFQTVTLAHNDEDNLDSLQVGQGGNLHNNNQKLVTRNYVGIWAWKLKIQWAALEYIYTTQVYTCTTVYHRLCEINIKQTLRMLWWPLYDRWLVALYSTRTSGTYLV